VTRLVALLGALTCWGCGTPAATVNPDETSRQGHLAEAAREHAAAEREATRYDPAATHVELPFVRDSSQPPQGASIVSNPTQVHLTLAEQHRLHALAHERAAQQLARFEAAECRDVPPAERAACPLLAPVVAIRDLRDGVRVELGPTVAVQRLIGDMRCHCAFARARGFSEEAAACPLYVRGLQIELSRDGRAIELRGSTRELADEIRQRVRAEAVFARP
jgi:hypothetical protein